MSWTSLCAMDELTEDRGKYVEISGFELAVFLQKGNVYVLDNTCPHANGPLAEGFIENGCVVCPLHMWTFKLENGNFADSDSPGITAYKIRLHERDGKSPLIQADLPIY